MVQISHFYHLYVHGQWEQILESHVESLLSSKLIDQIECLMVGIVGSEEGKQKAIHLLTEWKIPYKIVNYSENGWEQETLNPLHAFSKENDGVTVYAHSKGTSRTDDFTPIWREAMTHAVVDHWAECLSALESYDTVGPFYLHPIPQLPEHSQGMFYAGNFWWANNQYLRSLNAPLNDHRHNAEGWLFIQSVNRAYDIKNLRSEPLTFEDNWMTGECEICNPTPN